MRKKVWLLYTTIDVEIPVEFDESLEKEQAIDLFEAGEGNPRFTETDILKVREVEGAE